MADPKFLTWQEVLDEMLSFLPPHWRANFTGKILQRLMVAYALSMEALYGLLAKVLRLSIVATSEGQWLRSLVAGFGMEAYGGIAATVTVQFRRWGELSTIVSIPVGTELRAANGLTYRTTIASALQVGESEVSVPARCTRTGTAGNILPGQILGVKVPIEGIDEARNADPAVGGADPEADASIKRRVPIHLAMLHRATIPATEGAIASRPDLFPEVVSFITERKAGQPGYFRGVLADASGGDNFRPFGWAPAAALGGTYYTVLGFDEVHGLVEAGWPCRRFGIVQRDSTGKEVWTASASALEVSQGNYRWHWDAATGRLYARANGQDLNQLDLTILAGVVWRALNELEDNWAAVGIAVDVIVPFVRRIDLVISYELEPGYSAEQVSSSLELAVYSYATGLNAGASFELEALYARLNGVSGAADVLILIASGPESTKVERNEIIRAGNVVINRL